MNILTTLFFRGYGVVTVGAIILTIILLEWRSDSWPRYRRATLGVGTFPSELRVVLLSIFMMVVTAIVVAPALLHHGR